MDHILPNSITTLLKTGSVHLLQYTSFSLLILSLETIQDNLYTSCSASYKISVQHLLWMYNICKVAQTRNFEDKTNFKRKHYSQNYPRSQTNFIIKMTINAKTGILRGDNVINISNTFSRFYFFNTRNRYLF